MNTSNQTMPENVWFRYANEIAGLVLFLVGAGIVVGMTLYAYYRVTWGASFTEILQDAMDPDTGRPYVLAAILGCVASFIGCTVFWERQHAYENRILQAMEFIEHRLLAERRRIDERRNHMAKLIVNDRREAVYRRAMPDRRLHAMTAFA